MINVVVGLIILWAGSLLEDKTEKNEPVIFDVYDDAEDEDISDF